MVGRERERERDSCRHDSNGVDSLNTSRSVGYVMCCKFPKHEMKWIEI